MPKSKPKPQRDYKAEYQRRIARGRAKGLSRSQSRGHPKANEKPVRTPRPIPDKRLQISLRALRQGFTLAQAAKQIHVSGERLRNQANTLGFIEKRSGRWAIRPDINREVLIFSEGVDHNIIVSSLKEASLVGQYMSAVGHFLNSNDADHLAPFIGQSVSDTGGTSYLLETDPNAIFKIANSGGETFENVYRLVP